METIVDTTCYYNNTICVSETWTCVTCHTEYCEAHNHVTDLGSNVECVVCERERLATTVEPAAQEHTPTPWSLEYFNGNVPFLDIVGGKTDDPLSGLTVARWQFPERRPDYMVEQDKANAALIVAAVNAHADNQRRIEMLTEALTAILDHVEDEQERKPESMCRLCYSHRQLGRTALAETEVR